MACEGFGGFMGREGWGGGRRLLAALAAVLIVAEGLGGCARTPPPEPVIKTVEVKVPVPVPCKAQVDVHDTYSDAAAEFISDIYDQARALLKGREERKADQERLTGAVVGCGGTVK